MGTGNWNLLALVKRTWHLDTAKITKYSCLVNAIESNGWYVDLFATEVGDRGYCSRSITTYLKRLGFCNKLAFSTAKKLGQISMKSSFCIWLARNSRLWSQVCLPSETPSLPRAKINNSSKISMSKPKIPSKRSIQPVEKKKTSFRHAGLINKVNTCYANSILQVFSAIPSLWSQWPSESQNVSSLVKSVILNMSLLNRSPCPVDPSNFLRALEHKISSICETAFDCNTQQDVPEILRVVLGDFKGLSPLADSVFSTTLKSTVKCDTCFCSSVQEEKCDMFNLAAKKHITTSLIQLLQTESLSGDNMWSCPQCAAPQISTRKTHITSCSTVLSIQLNRYAKFNGDMFKDNRLVECLPNKNHLLKIPIRIDDTVSFSKEFSLVATINHSGNLNAGHYWAFIKESTSNSWLQCNDRSVLKVKPSALSNNSCYVLFYVKN